MPDPIEMNSPTISLEESVQRLKAEILSQDWRLSGKRAELLAAAFDCLKRRFSNRKTAFATIVMANNVLLYIRKKGDRQVPGTIDFLKEAMAHIVTFYEDPVFDPEKDKKLLQALYRRFNSLKEKIKADRSPSAPPQREEEATLGEADRLLREAADQSQSLQQAQKTMERLIASRPGGPSASFGQSGEISEELQENDRQNLEQLVRELKTSLQRAEDVGSTIRQLLVELISNRQLPLPSMETFFQAPANRETALMPDPGAQSAGSAPGTKTASSAAVSSPATRQCEKTALLLVKLGGETVGVEKKYLAARRPIRAERRQHYLKNNTIPLKDFKRLFHSLAGLFQGCLSFMKDSKLSTLSLPVIVPRGLNLPDKPCDTDKEALVLCNGNWCGILLCSSAEEAGATMVGTQQLNDGDLLHSALTEDGRRYPLLNTAELLKREGHMVVVP